jgi:Flp pilus assembly secretin CpaC
MRSDLGQTGRRLLVAAFLCAGSVMFCGPTMADDAIDVTIDFAKMLKIDRPAHTVVVGNPGIADASVSDDETLVLTGKTAGTTNLIVLDVDGEEILNAIVRVSSDSRQLTTVFYGAQRQTFSCAPVCEQVISVGDDPTKFENATTQIQTRQQFLTGQ